MSVFSLKTIYLLVALVLSGLSTIAVRNFTVMIFNSLSFASSEDTSYFREDYFTARALFRSELRKAGGELHSLPLEVEDMDLTIDIGLFRRSKKKLFVHISGTHGVEGFAGSAIQSVLLGRSILTQATGDTELPSVLFVHALNPFGFAMLRRWNEHNVDLNRNFMTEEKFQERVKMDPNAFGYQDLYELINPSSKLDWNDFFWFRAAAYLLRYGYSSIKQSLVTGNYHYPKSLFYGGTQLEPSHAKLSEFLQSHLDLAQIEHLGIIDVHTGLGPVGFDSLCFFDPKTASEAETIFGADRKPHFVTLASPEDTALSGYAHIDGFVAKELVRLFPHLKKVVPVMQEFGTVSGISVFKALREEGAAYRHDPSNRILAAQRVRGVFYLHDNPDWMEVVVDRGVTAAGQVFEWLKELP